MTRVLLILLICLAIHGHQTDAFFIEAISFVMTSLKAIFGFAETVKSVAERVQTVAEGFHLIPPRGSDNSIAIEIGQVNAAMEDVSRRLDNVEENVSSISRTVADVAIGIRQLNAAMRDVSRQLYDVEENLITGIDHLRVTLLHRLPLEIQHDARLQQLTTRINEVNDVYENFLFYSNASHSYEPATIIRFMTDLVIDSSKLNNALDSVFDQLLSNEQISPNLLSVIMAVESHGGQRCGSISPQQKLFKIYQTIMLTEMQGYAMNVYAFGVLKRVHNASYSGELDKLETQFKRRCGRYLRSVKSAMSTMSTEVHLCEPASHVSAYHDAHAAFRSINFQPQIADVEKNMVVTGVRMVVKNSMLHLQIEQGKLMPLGGIERVDQPWKPIQHVSNSRRSSAFITDRTTLFNAVPDDFVVTGLRFAYVRTREFQHDQIKFVIGVHATKYNSDTGNLERSNSMWISDATPTLSKTNVTTREVDRLDVRPVSMEPRYALSGIGWYFESDGSHKSLGLRLFGWNTGSQMKTDLS